MNSEEVKQAICGLIDSRSDIYELGEKLEFSIKENKRLLGKVLLKDEVLQEQAAAIDTYKAEIKDLKAQVAALSKSNDNLLARADALHKHKDWGIDRIASLSTQLVKSRDEVKDLENASEIQDGFIEKHLARIQELEKENGALAGDLLRALKAEPLVEFRPTMTEALPLLDLPIDAPPFCAEPAEPYAMPLTPFVSCPGCKLTRAPDGKTFCDSCTQIRANLPDVNKGIRVGEQA